MTILTRALEFLNLLPATPDLADAVIIHWFSRRKVNFNTYEVNGFTFDAAKLSLHSLYIMNLLLGIPGSDTSSFKFQSSFIDRLAFDLAINK